MKLKLSPKQIGLAVSCLATALLHLMLFPRLGFDPIFLNGFGYIALLGAYFLPIPALEGKHTLVWWALVGYTILTFTLWVILGHKEFAFDLSTSSIGYYAKTAELILLVFLWLDKPKDWKKPF